jgi:hypothetical protein
VKWANLIFSVIFGWAAQQALASDQSLSIGWGNLRFMTNPTLFVSHKQKANKKYSPVIL